MADLREQIARLIAFERGADPDAPITIGTRDGPKQFDVAWEGYADIADKILALVEADGA